MMEAPDQIKRFLEYVTKKYGVNKAAEWLPSVLRSLAELETKKKTFCGITKSGVVLGSRVQDHIEFYRRMCDATWGIRKIVGPSTPSDLPF